jgi:hypothetical protein
MRRDAGSPTMSGDRSTSGERGRDMPARPGSQELEKQIGGRLAALQRELGPDVPAERVAALGRYHADRLLAGATITDFIPQLVYRATKEQILRGDALPEAIPAAA